ncbi:MAG: hypothetical protein QUU85_07645 [Candidatus Eisenbacteria bacterium]|nr:hypothetical protein [Candidatus Eisenbacteria bacterium]
MRAMLREGTRVGPRLRTHRRAGSPLGWILAFALLAAVATFLAAVPRSSAGLASGSDVASGSSAGPATAAAPARLADTGLYSDPATRTVAQENIPYEPQYPLWSDGAVKRRWVHIPPGTHIDASDPDHWQFPIGTRFWKEFSFDGRPVETRFITRGDNGEWMYFAYRWNAEGTDAVLAPEQGIRSVVGLSLIHI